MDWRLQELAQLLNIAQHTLGEDQEANRCIAMGVTAMDHWVRQVKCTGGGTMYIRLTDVFSSWGSIIRILRNKLSAINRW